jgi:tetrahydromethanopterin S-methyltransferase subunit F
VPKVAGGQKKRHNSGLLSIKRRQGFSAGVLFALVVVEFA